MQDPQGSSRVHGEPWLQECCLCCTPRPLTRDASLPGLNLSKIHTLGRSDKWIANYIIILLCSSSKKCLVKN